MVYMYQKYSWLTRCFAYFSGYMITLWLSIFCNAVIAQLLFKISSFDASDKCVCQFFISDNNLGFFWTQFLEQKYEIYWQLSKNATRKGTILSSYLLKYLTVTEFWN